MKKINLLDLPEAPSINLNSTQIKKWETQINLASKDKAKQNKIRQDFKKQFGVAYSKILVAEIIASELDTGLKPIVLSPESKTVTPSPELILPDNKIPENLEDEDEIIEAEVRHAVINLKDFEKKSKDIEDDELAASTAKNDSELIKTAAVIDDFRDQVVTEAEVNLNKVANFDVESLSEEQKIEIAAIEKDMAKATQIITDEKNKLNKPDLSPEDEKKIYQKIDDMVEYQVYAFNKLNQIKGIKTPEPEVTLEKTTETTLEKDPTQLTSSGPEVNAEVSPATSPETSPETNITSKPEPSPEVSPKVELNKFEKEFFDYAKKMGIKQEQLIAHPEFMELNPVQRQFILETLNRSASGRVKIEGNQNYLDEKASKKWYQFGYAINENFHKKKHQSRAAKNIYEQGLAGYGEEEFNWLVANVKTGPEIIIKDDQVEVNYLRSEGLSEERLKLFNDYNKAALAYSNSAPGSIGENGFSADLKEQRNKILMMGENPDEKLLFTKQLLAAEKEIEFSRSVKADQETAKIMEKLIGSSSGGWKKFIMFAGSHKDKGGYMALGMASRALLRHEVATNLLSKAFSYSVGPAVAAVIGGLRANNRARKELEKKDELNEMGVEDMSDLAKTYNLAVGRKDKDGTEINFGLADKINDLVAQINSLSEKSSTLSGDEYIKAEAKILDLRHRLRIRVDYTKARMNDELISYGSPEEAASNRYTLLNSLVDAQLCSFENESLLEETTNYTKVDRDVKKTTRLKGRSEEKYQLEVDVNEHRRLLIADRLASFLDFNESKRSSAEFKYLLKKTAWGAALGATFAAVGAFVFEQTGLGQWIGNKTDIALRAFSSTKFGGAVNSVISEARHHLASSNKMTAAQKLSLGSTNDTIQEPKLRNLEATDDNLKLRTGATDDVLKMRPDQVQTEEALKLRPGQAQTEEALKLRPGQAEAEAPLKMRAGQIGDETPSKLRPLGTNSSSESSATKLGEFSDKISNENLGGKSDSVWRSAREIFKTHAAELGYKGDLNNTAALDKWAEIQTASAIHNTGEFTNKVFEGNRVILEKNPSGDFIVKVEAADGPTPGYAPEPGTVQEVSQEAQSGSPLKAETEIRTTAANPQEVIKRTDNLGTGKSIETNADEIAADNLALKYGLDPKEYSYGGADGIIKTTVDGHEIFIDTIHSQAYVGSVDGPISDINLKGTNLPGEYSPAQTVKELSSYVGRIENLAHKLGFEIKAGQIESNDQIRVVLGGRDIVIDFQKNIFSYEANGAIHDFSLPSGEDARGNMETFLAARLEIETAADEIQTSLMNGKIKSFKALEHRLEDLNNGKRLSEETSNLWREIYTRYFAKSQAGIFEDSYRFRVLQNSINNFVDGLNK